LKKRYKAKMRRITQVDWQLRVEDAIRMIISDIDNRLSLTKLASLLESSSYHFHRMFKQLTGESVCGCIKRLRLERAGFLLKNSDRKIIDIALNSGFNTSDAFTKAFKQSFTLTPSNARKVPAWKWQLPSRAGIHYGQSEKNKWFLVFPGEEKMNTKIVEFVEEEFIGIKMRGSFWQMPEIWEKFTSLMNTKEYYHPKAKYSAVFFDAVNKDVSEEDQRWAVAMSVGEEGADIVASDGLERFRTPGGLYLVVVHFGSHESIGEVWNKHREQILEESRWKFDVSRPSFEWYQNDPATISPELLLTFLCDPVVQRQ
jgi:AraC family transcriptional regulator